MTAGFSRCPPRVRHRVVRIVQPARWVPRSAPHSSRTTSLLRSPGEDTSQLLTRRAWRLQRDQRRAGSLPPDYERAVLCAIQALPDHLGTAKASASANSSEKVLRCRQHRFFGFTAGPTKYVIDACAVRSAAARLPVSESLYFEFYAGPFSRAAEWLPGIAAGKAEFSGRPLLPTTTPKLLNVTAVLSQLGPRQRHLAFERWPIWSDPRARDGKGSGVCLRGGRQRAVSTDVGVRNTRGDGALTLRGARGLLAVRSEHSSEGRSFQSALDGHDTGGPGEPSGPLRPGPTESA